MQPKAVQQVRLTSGWRLWVANPNDYGKLLGMEISAQTIEALAVLRDCLPRAAADLNLDFGEGFDHWRRTLDRKLLPRLGPGFPLVAAICGGGSAGKSTLFNTLAGRAVSPTGGRAGLNRRVLIGATRNQKDPQALMASLTQAFGVAPQPLQEEAELLTPGDPLYCTLTGLPAGVVLLDTPDIDTGAAGVYANRDLARLSLEVADLFIYIFTNTTYNNRDNTDFLARMFTGMGRRPCYLVYRVYPSFSDDEVREHAQTVTDHIYGPAAPAEENVLGVFRADEDNGVAAGEHGLMLKPVAGGQAGLSEALAALDPVPLRARLLGAMFEEAVHQAAGMGGRVRELESHLDQYARALEAAQEQSVRTALSHFPADRVLRHFAKIWLQSDPAHIRWMRRTGRVIEWPLKTVVKAVHHLNKENQKPPAPTEEAALERQVEMDLLTAANTLYQKCLDTRLSLGNRSVFAPDVVQPAQAELAGKPWQPVLEGILDQKEEILSWSSHLERELGGLADELRGRMRLMDQIRQTFAALLNVIPATAAVTYILSTGDPVGAVGIKVKLTGLFGLHDLYALIAIPATAGMSKADRKQLDQLLAPLARTWLANKFKVVQALFETHISGRIFDCARTAGTHTAELVARIEQALAVCGTRMIGADPRLDHKPELTTGSIDDPS
jgi:hypothetical protein